MSNRPVEMIEAMGREHLIDFFDTIRAGGIPEGWDCRGRALEYCFLRGFALEMAERMPHAIGWPYPVCWPELKIGIAEQIDGVIYTHTGAFLVEAKAETQPIDVEPLAKLRFRLEGRPPGTMGILLSLSGFSRPASFFAQFAVPLNVLLWSAEDVFWGLRNARLLAGLDIKLRQAIERRVPDYNLEVEEVS